MIYELPGRKPVMKGDYYVAPNAAVIGTDRRFVVGFGRSVLA